MKFLCDQMLVRLGRWLRAAGYDTEIIEQSIPDDEILEQAIEEGRLLLTRDKHLREMRGHRKSVIWLDANTLEDCVKELTKQVDINWMKAPFSRCLLCNNPLVKAAEEHLLQQVPEDILEKSNIFWYCGKCQKVYWEGSHTQRMRQKLMSW
jgi:uncharacterized protein